MGTPINTAIETIEGAGVPEGGAPTSGMSRGFSIELCFLGFGLVVAASTSSSLVQGGPPQGDIDPGAVSNMARLATFLVLALASGKIGSLAAQRWTAWAAGACYALGIMVTSLAGLAGIGLPVGVLAIGLVLAGVGYAALYLMWLELYARMDLAHVLAYFTLMHLVSAAVSFALSLVGAVWFVAVTLLAMPLVSAALLRASELRAQDAPFMQGEEPASGWTTPWQPVLLLATFTFANGFVRQFLSNDLRGLALVGVIAAAAAALALLGRIQARGLSPLYAVSMPLIVAGALCVPVAMPGLGAAGAILTNAAYTLFSVYTTVLLCNMSFRYGVSALWLLGFAQAAVTLGSLANKLFSDVAMRLAQDPAALSLLIGAIVVVLVCLYVVFDRRDDRVEAWGIRQTGHTDKGMATVQPAPANSHAAERTEEVCARLARQYGLTRREEEVALLLVQGMSFAQIEESLYVSNSTLKTHARHIYAKTGVSGRAELTQLAGVATT